jgi:hypothetical protein
VTEVELVRGVALAGEQESLAPGFSGQFTVQLLAGTYSCGSLERRRCRDVFEPLLSTACVGGDNFGRIRFARPMPWRMGAS